MFKMSQVCGIGFMLSFQVMAAGYDCNLDSLNDTEKTICGDAYLNSIDNVVNKFFLNALEHSLSKGSLVRGQKKWIAERNRCKADIECIKNAYITRNQFLSRFSDNQFHPVRDVFVRQRDTLDDPMEGTLKNKNGFTISEEQWRVKQLISTRLYRYQLPQLNGSTWQVFTHRIINGDLVIFFLVDGYENGKKMSYLVSFKEFEEPSIISKYQSSAYNEDIHIKLISKNKNSNIIYSVTYKKDPETTSDNEELEHTLWYEIKISDKNYSMAKEISVMHADTVEKNWVGYCGEQECKSRIVSPNGKWRLASATYLSKSDKDEGMYYFASNRPDSGVNVFLTQTDTIKPDDWNYDRNYTWGDASSFYFDNAGGMACIWQTDIINKTTKRILPVEDILNPYYLKYDGKDFIIADYSYYDQNLDKNIQELYISKK